MHARPDPRPRFDTELIESGSTGATRVLIFDHTIRRQLDSNSTGNAIRGPVRMVHIDQSYSASVNRVRYHLPDEAEELLQKRFQIINVSPNSPFLLYPCSCTHLTGVCRSGAPSSRF